MVKTQSKSSEIINQEHIFYNTDKDLFYIFLHYNSILIMRVGFPIGYTTYFFTISHHGCVNNTDCSSTEEPVCNISLTDLKLRFILT
jgi:hypothetical protein